jgi:glycine betaine/proline transport system substrate-binding protein
MTKMIAVLSVGLLMLGVGCLSGEPAASTVEIQATVEASVATAIASQPVPVVEPLPTSKVIVKEIEVEKVVEVVVTATPASVPAATATQTQQNETIIFSDLHWSSALLQNRIAAYIVEHGYGYPVDFLTGDTVSLWSAVVTGDSHVAMEIWMPEAQDFWASPLKYGTAYSVGTSLSDQWYSMFVIPKYTQEANPGLVSYTDIEAHKDLFVRPDSDGKAALINCIAGWKCQEINTAKHELYGMDDYVKLMSPSSEAALFADLEGAYENGDNWLGYLWGPNKRSVTLDLVVLAEPTCLPGCDPSQGYAYPGEEVLIVISTDLESRAPDVVDMLRKYDFVGAEQVAAEIWMAANEATETEAAINWLSTGIYWHAWVTDEARANVYGALAAGKTVSNAD